MDRVRLDSSQPVDLRKRRAQLLREIATCAMLKLSSLRTTVCMYPLGCPSFLCATIVRGGALPMAL